MSVSFERQQEIRRSIREFFEATAKQNSEEKMCPECGDEMKTVAATFSLSGTDFNWTVALPTCSCSGQGNVGEAA